MSGGLSADRIRFPFGVERRPRSARRPVGTCDAFVLGVYPSALHVGWDLPAWAHAEFGASVGALAVADEPTVFWDGADADVLVEAWMREVGFRTGDGPGEWGHVRAAGNGTSGRPVRDGVLPFVGGPMGVDVDAAWFTDALNVFFVKRGGSGGRQQGDVHDVVYGPFADRVGLPAATLPTRPSPTALVRLATADHRDRLRAEFVEAGAPVVVTLGEEARLALSAVADAASGAPTVRLTRSMMSPGTYGRPGRVTISGSSAHWYALVHPGNRDPFWSGLHRRWQDEQRPDLAGAPA